jgi:hypothetical protein
MALGDWIVDIGGGAAGDCAGIDVVSMTGVFDPTDCEETVDGADVKGVLSVLVDGAVGVVNPNLVLASVLISGPVVDNGIVLEVWSIDIWALGDAETTTRMVWQRRWVR